MTGRAAERRPSGGPSGASGRRRRRGALSLVLVLLAGGAGAGTLLGLDARDSMRLGRPPPISAARVEARPARPATGTTRESVAALGPASCIGPCLERDVGYSWAAAEQVRDERRCDLLPRELAPGCRDYVERWSPRRRAGRGR